MAAWHERRFEPSFFFQRHLSKALAIVELDRQQDIAHDCQQLASLFGHGLAAQEQPGRAFRAAPCAGNKALCT